MERVGSGDRSVFLFVFFPRPLVLFLLFLFQYQGFCFNPLGLFLN